MNLPVDQLTPGTIVVLGVPYDASSSFLRGSALAPARIRETLHSGSANWFTELGMNLQSHPGWVDMGDIALPSGSPPWDAITEAASDIYTQGAHPLALGGDHSITFPLVRAAAAHHGPLTILHLDAHPDLYDQLDGERFSHACPFARIMEAGLGSRLVQVGLRTITDQQRAQIERFGVEVIEMSHFRPDLDLKLNGPLYLSLDMDVFDPAFAPGVSHHEPGGMTSRDVLQLLHRLPGPILAADLVEFNPARDLTGITAALGAKMVKEIIGHMLSRPPELAAPD